MLCNTLSLPFISPLKVVLTGNASRIHQIPYDFCLCKSILHQANFSPKFTWGFDTKHNIGEKEVGEKQLRWFVISSKRKEQFQRRGKEERRKQKKRKEEKYAYTKVRKNKTKQKKISKMVHYVSQLTVNNLTKGLFSIQKYFPNPTVFILILEEPNRH